MAWYPGAVKMELQPESDQQPAIRPTQFIVHSIVGPWTARRTYEYWRSTNLESHFGIGYAGDIAQYIGTETRADANAAANRRSDGTGAISVETASNLTATDPWTDEQVEELIKVGVWAHERHGIPLRLCRSADDPGFGWHKMFSAWNPDAHSCPGPARIKQFTEIVFPGIVARAKKITGSGTTREDTDMPQYVNLGLARRLTLRPGRWDAIEFTQEWTDETGDHATGGSSFVSGPSRFTGELSLHLSGLPAGREVQVRQSEVDSKGAYVADHPIGEVIGTGGDAFGKVPVTGRIGSHRRMRIRVKAFEDTPVTVMSAVLKVLVWKES